MPRCTALNGGGGEKPFFLYVRTILPIFLLLSAAALPVVQEHRHNASLTLTEWRWHWCGCNDNLVVEPGERHVRIQAGGRLWGLPSHCWQLQRV